jgi:hypothetical protein
MVSKAQKIRQPEGIKLLPEIAFFRNVPTDLPLLPPLLAASSRLLLGDEPRHCSGEKQERV